MRGEVGKPKRLRVTHWRAGRVGGLLILETLIINDLCQCHPPSPLIFIESADWDFRTI